MSDITNIPQIHPAPLRAPSALLHRLCFYPVLLTHGPYTKLRTPRLPEPAGAREGRAGYGRPLRLLMTGDSSAAGVGVAHQRQALSGHLVRDLARRAQVDWRLVARCGNTTPAALAQLKRARPDPVDVAVVGLGVNDITTGTPLRTWLRRTDALIDHLRSSLGAKHIYLAGLPPMSQFPRLQNPLRWTLGHQAERFDRALRRHLMQYADVHWITLDVGLDDTNMAEDGYHPNETIYRAWAQTVSARVRSDFGI